MGKFNLASLQTRLVSGLILAGAVTVLIYIGGLPFLAMVGVFTFVAGYEWLRLAKHLPYSYLHMLAGLVYIAFGFWSGYALREVYGIAIAFLFVGLIWLSDTGAYFMGKTIGGPKLARHISPNKTWAGFAGAVLCPALFFVLFLALYLMFMNAPQPSFLTYLFAAAIGGAIGVTGQVGDLLVSFFKRRAAVKDTGDIIPGHGGVLDRVDSLLLGAPVFYYLISAFPLFHG